MKTTEPMSGGQARQLATISEFTTDVCHVSGKDNIVADTPSRLPEPVSSTPEINDFEEPRGFLCQPVNAIQQGVDYRAMSAEQEQDVDIQAYRTGITNLQLEDVPFGDGSFTLLCDVLTGRAQPIVPERWRRPVFDIVHSFCHPGARSTKHLVVAKFVWHRLNKQVTEWARSCISCQKSKVIPIQRSPYQNSRYQIAFLNMFMWTSWDL